MLGIPTIFQENESEDGDSSHNNDEENQKDEFGKIIMMILRKTNCHFQDFNCNPNQ